MRAKSILQPFYTKLRPLYVPLMTRSAILPVGERLLRFGLSRNMKKGAFIFLACMPKSGSTFITQLMHESTGFPMRGVMSSGENPDLDGTMIRALAGLGTVTQTHFICTAQYVAFANRYDFRTLVLERNLLDVVVSYTEYMRSDEARGFYRRQNRGFVNTSQNVIFDDSFCDLPIERAYDIVIDLALPWYLRFHVAWKKYEREFKRPPLWLDYDDFFADVPGQARRVLDYCGIDAASVVTPQQPKTKFNVGRGGRGKQLLSPNQIARIERLADYYPAHRGELIRW